MIKKNIETNILQNDLILERKRTNFPILTFSLIGIIYAFVHEIRALKSFAKQAKREFFSRYI